MKASTYHVLLRISALTLTLVLLFDSGLLSPVTKEISKNTQDYLANSIGATASVQRNEINALTTEISARQRELDDREEAISAREINVGINTNSESPNSNLSTYILSIILFIIVVLMVLNYALDFARDRRLANIPQNGQAA